MFQKHVFLCKGNPGRLRSSYEAAGEFRVAVNISDFSELFLSFSGTSAELGCPGRLRSSYEAVGKISSSELFRNRSELGWQRISHSIAKAGQVAQEVANGWQRIPTADVHCN